MPSYRDEARRAFTSNAAQETQRQFFNDARTRHPALQRFESLDDALAVLAVKGGEHDLQDAVLLAFIAEHQAQRDGRAFALLARVMFATLDHLFRQRRSYLQGFDRDDLWGRIVEAFAEALDRYPIGRRKARVAANMKFETMAALGRSHEREVRVSRAQGALQSEVAPFLAVVGATGDGEGRLALGDFAQPGNEAPVSPSEDELEQAARVLDPFVAAGVIDAEDKFLIVGVHVHGRSLAELARSLGIGREAAKKRHLRALGRLRRTP